MLIQELTLKDKIIDEKSQVINNKDKKILEISNENTKLHLRINSVGKEI